MVLGSRPPVCDPPALSPRHWPGRTSRRPQTARIAAGSNVGIDIRNAPSPRQTAPCQYRRGPAASGGHAPALRSPPTTGSCRRSTCWPGVQRPHPDAPASPPGRQDPRRVRRHRILHPAANLLPGRQVISTYARRMNIEQRLAEAIQSFSLDALAGAVPLNVDLDVVLSVLAHTICTALRRRLPGYHTATPPPSSAGSSTPAASSKTTAARSPSGSTGAPTHPSCARPARPKRSPSAGGTAAPSATSTTDRVRYNASARHP
jgi:hypothetical protein